MFKEYDDEEYALNKNLEKIHDFSDFNDFLKINFNTSLIQFMNGVMQ